MSEIKDVQSSPGANTKESSAGGMTGLTEAESIEPNQLKKGSHESLDKMSYLSHKQEEGWHVSRHQVKWQ